MTLRDFSDHYSERSDEYRRTRPTYPPALIDWLASFARDRALAWDAGCGSGQLSVPLARVFERVVGSDASVAQIMAARAHPRVHYRVARAEASGLPNGVADLCVAAQAVHWFDVDAYAAEVARVGRPRSRVALVTYGRPRLPGGLDAALQRFHTDVLAPFWPSERRHVDAAYRSIPFPFSEVPAPAFDMTHHWALSRFNGYVETWSAVRAARSGGAGAAVDAFTDELAGGWGEPDKELPVRWLVTVRAGTVAG